MAPIKLTMKILCAVYLIIIRLLILKLQVESMALLMSAASLTAVHMTPGLC